jgi:hypothetical protein
MGMNDQPGYTVSLGWVDPTNRIQNLPILKNSSSYFIQNVKKWGWQYQPVLMSNKKIKRFAILRDPYSRWLSGFKTDLHAYCTHEAEKQNRKDLEDIFINSNAYWFFDFLFDKDILKFDSHTNLQYNQIKYHIEELGIENISFIKMTDRLGDALNHWIGTNNVISHFTNAKVNETEKLNIYYKRLIDYLSDVKNASRVDKLMDYLQPDYKLFNTVNFVNSH